MAYQAQRLASVHIWKAAQDSNEVAFPRCFEPGNGIAGIFSVIGHPLYDALQVFFGRGGYMFGKWIR